MRKYLLISLLTLAGFSAWSQNNGIFKGGINDGYSSAHVPFITGNSSIFNGGIQDGSYSFFLPFVTPSVLVIKDPLGAICDSSEVIFTAQISNAGSNPLIKWYHNETLVATNVTVYSTNVLALGDSVYCVLIPQAANVLLDTVVSNITRILSVTPLHTWYQDADGDGKGNIAMTIRDCTQPVGYVSNANDCDDSNPNLGLLNLFFRDLDGDGYGAGAEFMLCARYNEPPTGFSEYGNDCDDTNPAIHALFGFYPDGDGDGFGAGAYTLVCAIDAVTPPAGYSRNNNDCDDNNASVFPGAISSNRPYRTAQDGDWSLPSTWEQFDGCNWLPGSVPDESVGVITISHDVTVNTAGIVGADQIVITGIGSLRINSRFFLRDGPGDDLINTSGDGITINEGGRLSGTGTVNNQGRADVYGAGVIAVPFINNGNFFFTHATQGCCPGGLINFTDGLTTGRFDNYGSFFIFATPGISQMNIVNGEFYNHTGAYFQANYKTNFDVSKFTNDGDFSVGVTGVSSAVCTIKSDQGSTHSGGRFKSNGNSMQFVMQTNGTFTYAANCIIDANMHFSTGTHDILSTQMGTYDTRVSTTVNCAGTTLNFPGNVYVDAGNFGGPATKKIGGTLIWPSGTISGGDLVINDTASAQFGAGQTTLGTLATTLVNNGIINIFNYHGGCCSGPSLNMANGTIENNGQFIFSPTGGGGIYNVTLSGGTFNNNAGGTLINNATAVSPWGDNESYLRNTIFTNNGTILANGKSLNIFPTTDPMINGTVTVAAGAQVKFGAPNTTTTISPSAVINGEGTVYFFEGNHQVNSTAYNAGITSIGQTYTPANVYFNAPNVALNYVYMTSGVLGGPAIKLLKDDMVFIYGQITGGAISNTDTSVFHYGAGNSGLGAMNTAFTNNGVVEVNASYGGCCSDAIINLAGGSITNNGTFNVTGSGGIRYIGLSNGTFTNNAGAVINSNVGDMSFGDPSFRLQPASFVNLGTINLLRNKMMLDGFTVGGVINTSPGTELRSAGTVIFNGTLINNNGNITAPIDYNNASVKTIKGTGTFSNNMSLTNAATVTPGGNPGILNIAGNYNQGSGTLDIEIAGTTPGSGHDRLAVSGTATLSGTLAAAEINGFNPQTFTSIDILTASSVTGTFSQLNLPPFWSVQYASNKVSLVKFFEFVYYRDADNDGFGNFADTIHRFVTTAPAGYTADSTDCNDNNAAVNPVAVEICDGIDNNCDGIVDTIFMPGLILYMPLNGNANDLSANHLNGTVNGSVTATADRFGNAGGAMSFPGNVNSHISLSDHPLLRPSSVSFSAWVNLPNLGYYPSFISKAISSCYNVSWQFGADNSNNFSTWIYNSTNCGDNTQITTPISLGSWRHVVFTLDDVSNVIKLYVNGVLLKTGTYTATIPYDGNPVLIGAATQYGTLNFPMNGSMDDVMIFNRAITATEVTTLFTQGSPIVPLNARYYADADGDGYGNPAVSQLACSQPTGYVLNNTDCDDTRSAVNPGAPEICDGLDNNCDGQIDMSILTTGLVAYYPFSGNANDAVGSLNGTVNGATLTTDRFGNANSAYNFDGVNDFIGLNGSFNGYNELTISAWYKMTAASPDLQAIVSSDQSGKFVHTQISSGGISNCAVYYDNNNAVLLNIPPPALNQWVHLAIVAKSGNSKLYINGAEYSSSNATFSFISGSDLLRIGSGYLNGRFFNGSIDDIKIYSTALTPAQVLQDYSVVPLSLTYYADADGDGYGNPAVSQVSCSQPSGYVQNNTDCDDTRQAVHPGAEEVCDGLDNDCNGIVDGIEVSGFVCGMATSEGQSFTLTAPPGKVFTAVDFASYGTPDGSCGNFTLGSCHASTTMSVIQGLVIGQNSVTLTQNYQLFGDPCVGVYKRLYVQARYSNIVPLSQTYYADADGDGFGNPAVSQVSCSQPSGYVLNNTDCDDTHSTVYPGATEICDGLDNDCDGNIDAVSTIGVVCGTANEGGTVTLTAPAGKLFTAVSFASYGTPEGSCNNFSLGSCHASNSLSIVQSMVVGQNSVSIPASNGLFGDPCSGTAKRLYIQATYGEITPLAQTYYVDTDGDGFGNPAVSQVSCSQPAGYVLNNTDCDDTRSTVNPGAPEICDGLDNNCDGMIETAYPTTGLVAYYPFNGNANDAVGSFHGTLTGATLSTDRFGNANSAYQFNGINQSISAPVATTVTDNFALTGWARLNNYSSGLQILFCNGNSSGSGWGLLVDHTGKLFVIYGGVVLSGTTGQIPLQTWKHVALTRVSGTTLVYVDGAQVFNSAIPAPSPATNNLTIGVNNLGTEFFNGSLDEIKIYHAPLTAVQVKQDYNAGLQSVFYQDADADGFGNPSVTATVNCGSTAPSGYVSDNTDCNDANPNIYPGVSAGTVSGMANLCIGATTTYSSSGQTGGTWSTGNADVATVDPGTGLVTAIGAGTTSITYTIASCNGPLSASQSVNVISTPVINTVNDLSLANASSTGNINFTGTANTYQWTNNTPSIGLAASGTGNIPSFTAVNPGISPVTATITVTPVNTVNGTSCSGSPVSFTINVSPTAVFTLNPVSNQVVCAQTLSSAVVFSSSTAGVSYSWTNSEPSISLAASGTGDIPAFLAQNSGITDVTATITVTPFISDGNGGSINGVPVSFTIRVNHRPQMTALNDLQFCRESTTDPIVFGGAATSFTWTNNNTGIGLAASGSGDIPAFTATNILLSTPMVATIQVIPFTNDGITCQGSSEQFSITVHPKPVMNNVADQTYCNDDIASVVFSGIAVSEYNWVSSNTLFGIDPFGTGNLGPAAIGFNSNVPVVTSFTVTPRYINNAFTCLGDPKTFTITINPRPTLDAVADQRLCLGQSTAAINFTSNLPNAIVNWTNSIPAIGLPATGSGNIPSFMTSGTGNSNLVARAEAEGCLGGIRNFSIIVDPAPVISPVSDVTVCHGSNINNIIIGSPSFIWTNSNPAIGLPASGMGIGLLPEFVATNNGLAPISATITVTAISNNPGCTGVPVSFQITVNPSATMDAVAHQFFCNGSPTSAITFNSPIPGTVYNWINSDPSIGLAGSGTGNIPSFTPAITSINPVDATILVTPSYTNNGVACTTQVRDFVITVKPLPVVNDIANKIVCNGTVTSVEFSSFNGLANYFTWTNSNPSIGLPTSGTGNIPEFSAINNTGAPLVATITVTPFRNLVNNIDCEGQSRTFTITVNPTPNINAVSNQAICHGNNTSPVSFTGNVVNATYSWTNIGENIGGAMTGTGNIPAFTAINNSGIPKTARYLVRPTFTNGIECTGPTLLFEIVVQPISALTITANGATTFCEGGSVTLTSSQPTGNIWSNGANTQSITVGNSGSYFAENAINPGCPRAVSNTIIVTATPSLQSAATINTATTIVCRLAPVVFSANVTNINAATYRWFENNVQVSTNPTYTSTTLTNNATVKCTISGTNPCNNNLVIVQSNVILMTVLPVLNAGSIIGPANMVMNTTAVFGTNGNRGGTWSTDNQSVLTVNPVSGSVVASGIGSANIRYTISSGCGSPTFSSKLVTVFSNDNLITGPDEICITNFNVFAALYNYVPGTPAGGTWNSGNNAIVQLYSNPLSTGAQVAGITSGTTTINYTLPGGGGTISKTITVNPSEPLPPIEGPRNLCRYAHFLYLSGSSLPTFTYTRAVAYPVTGYNWQVPPFLEIVSGQGTSTLTVRLISDVINSSLPRVYARPINACPTVVDPYFVDLEIWAPLPTPSPIVASSTNICESISTGQPIRYSTRKVPDAVYYDWSFPAGTANIVHPEGTGINDTTVLVQFTSAFLSGNISVIASNGCVSEPRSLLISRSNPTTPGLIFGPKAICAYIAPGGATATYSVAQQPSVTSYNWTVPAGAIGLTGQGTNTISFKYPSDYSSGTISVVAINGCGTSTARSLAVSRLNPSMPSVIDVINIVDCPTRQYTYSLSSMPSNATSVQWTTPGIIMSGQGSASIRVAYPTGAIIGYVTATAISNCGSSATRTVGVKIPACPPEFAGNSVNTGEAKVLSPVLNTAASFHADIFPNPAITDFNIRVTSMDKLTPVKVRLLDILGREVTRISCMPDELKTWGNKLKPGIYLIEMIQGDKRLVQKLVKQ